jgi:hypothetical protein
MKKLKIIGFCFLWCCLFLSCSKQESQIEGTYVNYHQGEFSVAWDTLIVSKIDEPKLSYKIESHTGFQRIRKGQLQHKEYANKTWIADWNGQTNAFAESLYYPPIRFTADGLLLKNTAFKKVK